MAIEGECVHFSYRTKTILIIKKGFRGVWNVCSSGFFNSGIAKGGGDKKFGADRKTLGNRLWHLQPFFGAFQILEERAVPADRLKGPQQNKIVDKLPFPETTK